MAYKFTIHGKVQGVYYRASAKQKAEQLGVNGNVINLSSGNVEVNAEGSSEAITQFKQWLQKGPALARVKQVDEQKMDDQNFNFFEILH